MVRPMTNCPPMMRMACIIAARITGSPAWRTMREMKPPGFSLASSGGRTMRPVSMSPHVEALTSSESDLPL